MTTFADTSGLLPLLAPNDPDHRTAATVFAELIEQEELVTHNYVVVEAAALAHRRIGWAAARDLLEGILPLFEVVWIDEGTHRAGEAAFLSGRSKLSLVDYISFEVMRRRGITSAFAFDRDFRRHGFRTIP